MSSRRRPEPITHFGRGARRAIVVSLLLVAAMAPGLRTRGALAAGAPDHLAFTVEPSDAVAGQAMAPAVEVSVEDIDGTVVDVPGNVTLSIGTNPGGGTLLGTTAQALSTGVASFADLGIQQAGSGYTLLASTDVTGLGSVESAAFSINPDALDHMTLAPADATIQAGDSQTYAAEGFDQYGNDLGDVTAATAFSIAPTTGSSCTGADCTAQIVGDYTVTGQDGSVSIDATLHVTAAAIATLQVTGPGTVQAGQDATFQAEGFDQYGNDLGDVTAQATFDISPAPGSCVGTAPGNNVCSSSVVGDYTVSASVPSGAGFAGGSADLQVTAAAPDHLAFDTQPTDTTAGATIAPAVTVEVDDQFDNLVTGSTASVTIAIASNPSAGVLSGTPTRDASAGVATFDDLSIDKAGAGYTLSASSGLLAGADSASFDVTPGVLDHLVLSPATSTVQAGVAQDYTAEGFDALNNDIGEVTAGTTFTIAPTSTPSDTQPCAVAACSATAADDYTVTGTDGAAAGTADLRVTAAAPDHLVFDTQPVITPSKSIMAPPVTVEVDDGFDNPVTDSTASITLAVTGGRATVGGTATRSAVGGVATFDDLHIDRPGTAYTLDATGPGLTTATSQTFNIQGGTSLTVTVSASLVGYQGRTNVTAHLAHWLTGRMVSIYYRPYAGSKTLIGSGNVNAKGNLTLQTPPLAKRTNVWATYAGDDRYLAAGSGPHTVRVRASVAAAMKGFYRISKSGYRLYHYRTSCPHTHVGCPRVTGTVMPKHPGAKIWFRLQAKTHAGRWVTITSFSAVVRASGSREAFLIYTGSSAKSVPLRVRVEFRGDADHTSNVSGWKYFEVT